MSAKGNVFVSNSASKQSTLETIRETLSVDKEGNVSFKGNAGKGSGKPISIPAKSYDEFVSLMQDVAGKRQTIADNLGTTESSESTESESEEAAED